MKYDMKTLIETFAKHAEEAQQTQDINIKRWRENYPNESPPKHFENEFSLPLALKAICEKIQEHEEYIEWKNSEERI
jgi:hypothetical protein